MGGNPMMLIEPSAKAPMVKGMARPMPSSSLTFVLCAATRIAPAQKKSVIFPMACIAMCMPPPMTPAPVASAAPRTM